MPLLARETYDSRLPCRSFFMAFYNFILGSSYRTTNPELTVFDEERADNICGNNSFSERVLVLYPASVLVSGVAITALTGWCGLRGCHVCHWVSLISQFLGDLGEEPPLSTSPQRSHCLITLNLSPLYQPPRVHTLSFHHYLFINLFFMCFFPALWFTPFLMTDPDVTFKAQSNP